MLRLHNPVTSPLRLIGRLVVDHCGLASNGLVTLLLITAAAVLINVAAVLVGWLLTGRLYRNWHGCHVVG